MSLDYPPGLTCYEALLGLRGPDMIRFIGAAVCVVAALFGAAALAQTVIAASPIRSFDWTYKGAEDPGDRHWSSPDGVAWTETYPSGRTQTQKVWAFAQVGGCSGVITKKLDSSNSQTFIPNPGCSPMLLLFRADDGPWRPIGVIRSISSQADRRKSRRGRAFSSIPRAWS